LCPFDQHASTIIWTLGAAHVASDVRGARARFSSAARKPNRQSKLAGIGGKPAGFDNETCTVTFNGNDLCHDVAVLTGRGDIELTYLMVGRNYIHTAVGLQHFSGVIDGGTGQFQNAHGAFQASDLPNEIKVRLPLGQSRSAAAARQPASPGGMTAITVRRTAVGSTRRSDGTP
jgi:hypothetical protein